MKCKGLIFKLNKSSYWSKDRLVFKQEFYLMKSLSCNNCPECSYIKDQLKIDICEHADPWLSSREIAHGTFFKAILHDEFESGLEMISRDVL